MAIFSLLDEQWGRAMNASGVRMQAFARGIGRQVVAAGLILVCLQEKSLAVEDNVFAGIAAEYHYRAKYKNMKGHKAFAIGPYGSYGYSWGGRTAKEAAKGALKSCLEDVAWWQKKFGVTGTCRLLAQDNKLLVSNPWIGPEWQKPLVGEDIPLLKGRNSKHAGTPVKGIVLHVHGCDGLGWYKFSEVWGAYFNAIGFSFFAPNSLAEARPAAICGWAPPLAPKIKTQ